MKATELLGYVASRCVIALLGDEDGAQTSTHNLGLLALNQADYRHARPALEEALAIAEKHEWDTLSHRRGARP